MCQQEYKSSSVKSVYVQHVKQISVKTGAIGWGTTLEAEGRGFDS